MSDSLNRSWADFSSSMETVLPRLLAVVVVVIVGWIVARALRLLTAKVLRWMSFNALFDKSGASEILGQTELPSPDALFASIIFWLVWVAFLLSAASMLGVGGVDQVVVNLVTFIPQLVVAIVILAFGLVASKFAWRATLLAAVNAKLPSPRLISGAVRALIVILTVAMALEQIQVAKTVVLTAFAISFGAVMTALAIAFGIGGGGVARRFLDRQFPEAPKREEPKSDGVSHL